MKKILILLITVFVMSVLASPVFAENTTVNFNLSSSLSIPKYIHGVNMNWYAAYPLDTAYMLKGISDVNFTTIRFPGGTAGNYYDWATLSPDWIYVRDHTPPINDGLIGYSKDFFDKHVKNLSAVEFIQTASSIGKNVNILVNVLTNTPAQIKGALQKIKDAGLQVQYMEMGNELYTPQNTEKLTPEAYLTRSHDIAIKAKEIFSDLKIGVVGNIDLFNNKGNHIDWIIPNEPWFDGIVIHPYTNDGPKDVGSQEYIAWITKNRAKKFDEFIDRFRKSYKNPDKELWLTEWNMIEKNEGEDESISENTYSQSYYVYDVLLNMLRYPEITLADFHNINSVIFRQSNEEYSKKSPFWPLAWIGRAFLRYNRFTIGTTAQENVMAVYFYNQNNPTSGSLAFINKSSSQVKITLSGISLGNSSFFFSVLSKPWSEISTPQAQFNPTTTKVNVDNIILPGYAIAYFSPQTEFLPTPILGDLTEADDIPGNHVNNQDYNMLISNFGKAGTNVADINKNGKVDIFDYALLVENYGK